jgi:hypothetical protein
VGSVRFQVGNVKIYSLKLEINGVMPKTTLICQIFLVTLVATSDPEEKKEIVSTKYHCYLENR